jgi:aryl-alcohol dehydrogenase-like predicted oxidoreductase
MSRLELVRKIAEESNITPSQVVHAWMRQSNPPVIPIVTASKEKQLIENIRSIEVTLTTEQLDRMHRVVA